MKIGVISGDMAVKLALGAGALVGAWFLWRKAAAAAGIVADTTQQVVDSVSEVAHDVNPLNNDNVIYTTVNKVTGGDDENTLGGRIYDFFHPWE